MAIKSNIKELIEKFVRLSSNAKSLDVSAALTQGVNAGRAAMINRIFNQGSDINNEPFGKYISRQYAKKRRSEGRQIVNKDLEFTGSLRRAIITAENGANKVGCFINNAKEFQIAKYQEIQIGKIRGGGAITIFALSAEERAFVKDQTNKALNQLYVGLFNN